MNTTDESGHRYTQPVFAQLEPHHFTVAAFDPTSVVVHVDGEVMNVTVFNASGRQVLFAEGRNNVGMEALPPGLYLVKENYRNGDSKVRKMVKK